MSKYYGMVERESLQGYNLHLDDPFVKLFNFNNNIYNETMTHVIKRMLLNRETYHNKKSISPDGTIIEKHKDKANAYREALRQIELIEETGTFTRKTS